MQIKTTINGGLNYFSFSRWNNDNHISALNFCFAFVTVIKNNNSEDGHNVHRDDFVWLSDCVARIFHTITRELLICGLIMIVSDLSRFSLLFSPLLTSHSSLSVYGTVEKPCNNRIHLSTNEFVGSWRRIEWEISKLTCGAFTRQFQCFHRHNILCQQFYEQKYCAFDKTQ